MKYIFYSLLALLLAFGCQNSGPGTRDGNSAQSDTTSGQHYGTRMDSINKLLSNDARNPRLLALRAKFYLDNRNMTGARNDITLAQSIDSNVAEVHEAAGEMAYMLNKSRKARNEWEKCIKLNPKNFSCLMRLTELYIAVQNYDRALELINRAIEIDHNNGQAYLMKGIIVRDKYQDTALALQYFQNAIDLDQNNTNAIDLMAVTLASRGDTLAKFYYHRLLELNPNRADVYYKLGVYYMQQKEINRALESYTKAIQINPKDADSYFNMGYIHIELRQFAKARDFFTQAIEAREGNYKAYYGRGYSFEMLGDVINAQKDYQKALEILPQYKPAYDALQRVKGIMNRPNE